MSGVPDGRRVELSVSIAALVRLSGIPRSTLLRFFAGRSQMSPQRVEVIAGLLGYRVDESKLIEQFTVSQVRETRARTRAKFLVGLVQGTMGLEGQAVDEAVRQNMEGEVVGRLLSESVDVLWR